MSKTPYFDAYEKSKASKISFVVKKKYITLSTGENVLTDIEFIDGFGKRISTIDEFVLT